MASRAPIGLFASVALATAAARGETPIPNEKVAQELRAQELRDPAGAVKRPRCRAWRTQTTSGSAAAGDRAAFERADRAFRSLRRLVDDPRAPRDTWQRAADDLLVELGRPHAGNTVWSWTATFRSYQIYLLLRAHHAHPRCPADIEARYGSEGCNVYREQWERHLSTDVDLPAVARCDAAIEALLQGRASEWADLDCVGALRPDLRCAN
jgi:hypothetical protein